MGTASLGLQARCSLGLPRRYRLGESETVLFDQPIRPYAGADIDDRACRGNRGDWFALTLPHDGARALGMRVVPPPGTPS